MIRRLCIGIAALAVSYSPAQACRVPNDRDAARLQKQRQHEKTAARADVIVKGILFERADHCDPSRHCGNWIQTVEIRKGAPASYYLIDPKELLITCSREFVKPGKIGTFHLQSNDNGMYLILADIR